MILERLEYDLARLVINTDSGNAEITRSEK